MNKAKLTFAGIGIVLVIIIVLQNTQPVETRILFMSMTMPRAVLLLVTFLIGLAIGFAGATLRGKRTDTAKSS